MSEWTGLPGGGGGKKHFERSNGQDTALYIIYLFCGQAHNTEAAALVKQLWTRFDELLQAPSDRDRSSELSSGQMLLMGFNGLFLQLEADFTAMLEAVTRLRVPDQWMTSIDLLAEASVLQV